NIPFAVFVANVFFYRRLVRSGSTFWDRSAKSRVECAPMSSVRVIICTVATVLAMITNSALLKAQLHEAAPRNPPPTVSAIQSQPSTSPPITPSPHKPALSADDIHYQKI